MAHPADERSLPLAAGEHPPVPGATKVSSTDMAERHHSARTKARKAALDVLFEADLLGRDPFESLAIRLDDPEQVAVVGPTPLSCINCLARASSRAMARM